jgi:hypothetical protein
MEIQCTFESGPWFDGITRYYCVVTSASITEPNTTVKAFLGTRQNGKTNGDVEGIFFTGAKVGFVPRGLHLIFPRLNGLMIGNCGLKEISRKDLDGLENLETLFLCDNQLTSLPRDLFVNMKKLKRVLFSRNKLEFVSSQMLQPLLESGATWVDFTNNTKINATYRSGKSGSVASLQDLMKEIDEKCEKPVKDPAKGTLNDDFDEYKNKVFTDLWKTGKFSDFVIIAEGPKEFAVHRSVLGTRSSGFAEMFENNFDQKELKIENLAAESVEQFLRFIYTGELSEKFNTKEVFALAAKFKIEALKSYCEEIILQELDPSNAFKVFNLGQRYSSDEMKRQAFEEIKKMFPLIDLHENLINMPEEMKKVEDMIQNLASFVGTIKSQIKK